MLPNDDASPLKGEDYIRDQFICLVWWKRTRREAYMAILCLGGARQVFRDEPGKSADQLHRHIFHPQSRICSNCCCPKLFLTGWEVLRCWRKGRAEKLRYFGVATWDGFRTGSGRPGASPFHAQDLAIKVGKENHFKFIQLAL